MGRHVRLVSPSGIYHAILKGIDGLDIFPGSAERREYMNLLQERCTDTGLVLYCYCFMSNHAHFLLNEREQKISEVMHSTNTSFGMYFNRRYGRRGPIAQDRFWSKPVIDKKQLFETAKYIHNNPVEAGLVTQPEDYYWSSFRLYLSPVGTIFDSPFCRDYLLNIIDEDFAKAVDVFKQYTLEKEEKVTLEDVVANFLKEKSLTKEKLASFSPPKRDPLLRELFEVTRATAAELSCTLGLSKDILYRARRS